VTRRLQLRLLHLVGACYGKRAGACERPGVTCSPSGFWQLAGERAVANFARVVGVRGRFVLCEDPEHAPGCGYVVEARP
jgi:hypothetical protein